MFTFLKQHSEHIWGIVAHLGMNEYSAYVSSAGVGWCLRVFVAEALPSFPLCAAGMAGWVFGKRMVFRGKVMYKLVIASLSSFALVVAPCGHR